MTKPSGGGAPAGPEEPLKRLESPTSPEVRAALSRVLERAEWTNQRAGHTVSADTSQAGVSGGSGSERHRRSGSARNRHGRGRHRSERRSRVRVKLATWREAAQLRAADRRPGGHGKLAVKLVGIAVLLAVVTGLGVTALNRNDHTKAPSAARVLGRPLPTVPGTEPVSIPTPVVPVSTPAGLPFVAPATTPPVAVDIPTIGVGAAVDPLSVDRDGALQVPTDFGRVGWFAGGSKPGEPGPAVLAGHIDSYSGPAVFYDLDKLQQGDDVIVRRVDGSQVTFTVQRKATYKKAEFPTKDVYGSTEAPTLRLITCTGTFDENAHSYEDNLVVYATLKG